MLASWYWSSSAYAPNAERAWSVLFDYGNDYDGYKRSYGTLRLVRGRQ